MWKLVRPAIPTVCLEANVLEPDPSGTYQWKEVARPPIICVFTARNMFFVVSSKSRKLLKTPATSSEFYLEQIHPI